ncbi:MAG TPA: universal stress protein [Burkholderiaceae bacterium]|nr:universal stress protein [Burkholderiaceae bacterium]
MFRKILLPTDGSELSLKALEGAVEMASRLGAKIVGMTVVEPYAYASISEYRPESMDDFVARTERTVRARLQRIEEAARSAGVDYETTHAESFAPYEGIIETAHRMGCDVIFMASHGRHGIASVLLGSETQKVLTHSDVPVLVYR